MTRVAPWGHAAATAPSTAPASSFSAASVRPDALVRGCALRAGSGVVGVCTVCVGAGYGLVELVTGNQYV